MRLSRILSLLCACGVALAILGTAFDGGTCFAQCTSCGVGYGTASALTTYTPAYTPRPSRRGPGYNMAACVTCKPRSYLAVPQVQPQVYAPAPAQPCSLPVCTPTYCTPTYCAPTCDPCGGSCSTCYRPVVAYRPVTTWVARPSLVPYISYRQPWTVTAYPASYAYYGTTYAAPVTSCASDCSSCALNGTSGCSSCASPPAAAADNYYSGATNSVSPADVTPSLPAQPAAPAANSPAPKTFQKPVVPEPKPRRKLEPIPEGNTRSTPAAPSLIDPNSRTTALPIRQASYFRPIPNVGQPVSQPADHGGWRAASD